MHFVYLLTALRETSRSGSVKKKQNIVVVLICLSFGTYQASCRRGFDQSFLLVVVYIRPATALIVFEVLVTAAQFFESLLR